MGTDDLCEVSLDDDTAVIGEKTEDEKAKDRASCLKIAGFCGCFMMVALILGIVFIMMPSDSDWMSGDTCGSCTITNSQYREGNGGDCLRASSWGSSITRYNRQCFMNLHVENDQGQQVTTAPYQDIYFYLHCNRGINKNKNWPKADSKSCSDAMNSFPVNTTFNCCFHTTDSGSTVDGEIRQGSERDWVGASNSFHNAGIALLVVFGILFLCCLCSWRSFAALQPSSSAKGTAAGAAVAAPSSPDDAYRQCFDLFARGGDEISLLELGHALTALGSPHSDDVDLEDEMWMGSITYEEFAAEDVPMDERPVALESVNALLAAHKNSHAEPQKEVVLAV